MSPRSRRSSTVLVIDDDPSVLSTYCRLLRRAGYRVLTESNPARLLTDAGATEGVSLVLLDYKMPGMDGLTLLAGLRRRECRARCILVSAFLNEDLRSQARNLGVDRVLEKPVDIAALRGAIDELVGTLAAERVAG